MVAQGWSPQGRPPRIGSGTPSDILVLDTNAFMATMNTMAKAVHEMVTTTTKVVNRLGEQNESNNGDNEINLVGYDRPMSLAAFLKVNPSQFKRTIIATEADNWFRSIEKSLWA